MEKKYKIGYTTGAFDLFHIGHLNILRQAKEQCEYLIVGVSTDELVQTYKHKTPMIPFDDRAAIVEAMRYVDKVVPQTSMDIAKAWQSLHFDVIFHGDDRKGSSLYNDIEKELQKLGVEIVFFPHTDGVNPAILTEKVKQRT